MSAGFGGDMPFNYFCYGAALSEVELDTLTGDFTCCAPTSAWTSGSLSTPPSTLDRCEYLRKPCPSFCERTPNAQHSWA